jgi:hypothetical protein
VALCPTGISVAGAYGSDSGPPFRAFLQHPEVPSVLAGKLADPQWRHERARKAASASHSLDSYVKRVHARRDELTPELVELLREALPPVGAAA